MKVEDRAFEHCCAKCVHDKFGCSMKVLSHGENCIKCGNYIKGYHQAKKDLKLTWEDVKEIYCIALNLRDHVGSSVFGQPFYEEVLKQFKRTKEL